MTTPRTSFAAGARRVLALLGGLLLTSWSDAAAGPPNVLLIVSDDLAACLGSYGNPV
jgi:hypothetical protein